MNFRLLMDYCLLNLELNVLGLSSSKAVPVTRTEIGLSILCSAFPENFDVETDYRTQTVLSMTLTVSAWL